jgi:hypothetical protein
MLARELDNPLRARTKGYPRSLNWNRRFASQERRRTNATVRGRQLGREFTVVHRARARAYCVRGNSRIPEQIRVPLWCHPLGGLSVLVGSRLSVRSKIPTMAI